MRSIYSIFQLCIRNNVPIYCTCIAWLRFFLQPYGICGLTIICTFHYIAFDFVKFVMFKVFHLSLRVSSFVCYLSFDLLCQLFFQTMYLSQILSLYSVLLISNANFKVCCPVNLNLSLLYANRFQTIYICFKYNKLLTNCIMQSFVLLLRVAYNSIIHFKFLTNRYNIIYILILQCCVFFICLLSLFQEVKIMKC